MLWFIVFILCLEVISNCKQVIVTSGTRVTCLFCLSSTVTSE
jgi:hypothetical protein